MWTIAPRGAHNLLPRWDPDGEQESESPQAWPAHDTCGAGSTVVLKPGLAKT